MIKITTLELFRNFLRVTHEFHDDKVFVKQRSLKSESDFEIAYQDIDEISDIFTVDNSQHDFAFILLAVSALCVALFDFLFTDYPFLLHIMQFLYIAGVVLLVTSFRKSWRILISDKKGTFATSIKLTKQIRSVLPEIIRLMKSKNNAIREITVADPFPEEPCAFEHNTYDYSDFEKSTDRFYEKEIIGFDKSIFTESVYRIRYELLSGKIYRGKLAIDIWSTALSIAVIGIAIISGFYFGFQGQLGIHAPIKVLYVIYIFLGLGIATLPLNLIKQEVVGFYHKDGRVYYWTRVSKKDKERFEKIIEFVQSKITIKSSETPGMEQP